MENSDYNYQRYTYFIYTVPVNEKWNVTAHLTQNYSRWLRPGSGSQDNSTTSVFNSP
jgi:hypothetical protein